MTLASADGPCLAAARRAAAATDVPYSVLVSIAQVETGRQIDGTVQPWPWAVNAGGTGHWFAAAQDALDFAQQTLAAGERSFDIGCFQLNYRWHGTQFTSLDQMMAPDANALYAARFLSRLHAELGDWSAAAGAYHSRDSSRASQYRDRFDHFRAAAEGASAGPNPAAGPPRLALAAPSPASPVPRSDTFPLFRAGSARRSAGSLFPLDAGS
ncbi:MAG: transglycosylase SLT domain-containing protein [Limimaricola sp.]|uniref:transglycosylase SLT domain-containing protein n=1 Tax=Limimaricola sp. TaxID=2211665 RepID=UPI001DD12D76|nr:transglycosylase SLT domain-containing protein [Limimaricola sp.]MBI1417346.1 transglycosylase SLT domain-containing protein [Limimaricola sp.]